jgi:hypothetical protein
MITSCSKKWRRSFAVVYCLGRLFNSKVGCFAIINSTAEAVNAASYRVVNGTRFGPDTEVWLLPKPSV